MKATERIETEVVTTTIQHPMVDITLTLEEAIRVLRALPDRPEHPLADLRAAVVVAVKNLRTPA